MPSNVPRRWTLGVALIRVAGCADEATAPAGDEPIPPTQEVAEKLTCRVNVASGGMECGSRMEAPGRTAGGPQLNLIVGSQHQFVRLANTAPVMDTDADTWRADVTVQNLTLQPMGTPDGEHGVRVFFVDEPSNGVEVVNYTGTAEFTGSESRKFYAYEYFDLGEDWVLDPGEVSEPKTWEFKLNGQTEFEFSVLVSAAVPDPNAYRVRLSNVGSRDSHVCAEGDDGKIYCWGYNQHGQLGDGSTTPSTIPVPVHAPLGVTLSKVWVGYHHTCAVDENGTAYCWGRNTYGQLGDGTTESYPSPVAVVTPTNVKLSAFAGGIYHTCALGDDDKAYCWGRNNLGQLGDGTTTDSSTPVEVELPQNVRLTRIVAGRDHTCGDASDGSVYCWGGNGKGQLGDGTTDSRTEPVEVAAPNGVKLSNVAAGLYHTCAEGDDGQTYCWGANEHGQLGDGTTDDRVTPVQVSVTAGLRLTGLAAAGGHTCGQGSDGRLYCWGRNVARQFGDGMTSIPTPVAMPPVAGIQLSEIVAGNAHTCAMGSNGRPYCWGDNVWGQLGDGTTVNRGTPKPVVATY